MARRVTVIGFFGNNLDAVGAKRWDRWRPSVSICQHEDFVVNRFELLRDPKFESQGDVVARDIAAVSPETEVRQHSIAIDDPWDFEQVFSALYAFTRAYRFDLDREDYLVHITTGTHVAQICLFLLTESRHFPARLLQTSPPRRQTARDPGRLQIIDLDLSRYDGIATRFREEQLEGRSVLKSGIETRNAAFNALIDRIERVAIVSVAPVLLTGPTGAGKSQLARRIYELKRSRRQIDGPFVEVNCATLRGDAAMSSLFGHRKGAFTGAVADRPGLLVAADKGLLFLDEIGELGADEQAMLLRAIEEKCFLPVGADAESHSEFQLIAGTNRDLRADVVSGRFREDLLARLDLWTFDLPGLRDRREDIEPNVAYELEKHASATGRKVTFNKEARERFLRFAMSADATWRANFRDLNAALTRMATLAPSGRIQADIVDEEIGRLERCWSRDRDPAAARDAVILDEVLGVERAAALDRFDAVQLADVLRVCRESRSASEAGRRLFAQSIRRKASRNDADRVRKYLARFDLTFAGIHGA